MTTFDVPSADDVMNARVEFRRDGRPDPFLYAGRHVVWHFINLQPVWHADYVTVYGVCPPGCRAIVDVPHAHTPARWIRGGFRESIEETLERIRSELGLGRPQPKTSLPRGERKLPVPIAGEGPGLIRGLRPLEGDPYQ